MSTTISLITCGFGNQQGGNWVVADLILCTEGIFSASTSPEFFFSLAYRLASTVCSQTRQRTATNPMVRGSSGGELMGQEEGEDVDCRVSILDATGQVALHPGNSVGPILPYTLCRLLIPFFPESQVF